MATEFQMEGERREVKVQVDPFKDKQDMINDFLLAKAELDMAEAKYEVKRQIVKNELDAARIDTYKNEFGTFSITRKELWEYSGDFKAYKEGADYELKERQAEERESGRAKMKMTDFLTFKGK